MVTREQAEKFRKAREKRRQERGEVSDTTITQIPKGTTEVKAQRVVGDERVAIPADTRTIEERGDLDLGVQGPVQQRVVSPEQLQIGPDLPTTPLIIPEVQQTPTGLKERIEETQAFRLLSSPKLTAALAVTLGGLVTAGVGTGAIGGSSAAATSGLTWRTALRSNAARDIARKFPATSKSQRLTRSFFRKHGAGVAAASALLATIGTYPFAGFIKEEALQTLDFSLVVARQSGDLISEEAALQEKAEILDPNLWRRITGAVPYVNIVASLGDYYEAAVTKLAADRRSFEIRKQEFEQEFERGDEDDTRNE